MFYKHLLLIPHLDPLLGFSHIPQTPLNSSHDARFCPLLVTGHLLNTLHMHTGYVMVPMELTIGEGESLSYAEGPDYLPDCIVIVRILGGIISVKGSGGGAGCFFVNPGKP